MSTLGFSESQAPLVTPMCQWPEDSETQWESG